MKKALIALISLVLVISTTFPAFAESEAMDGPFHMRWLAEGETHEDYNVNGLYRALLVYYAGLSLNMDEYSSNDVDLSDISNKYEISFDTHSAFITFNTRESYVVVFFMPNSDESFFAVYSSESPGMSAIIQEMTEETYTIDMQDFATVVDVFSEYIKQNSGK